MKLLRRIWNSRRSRRSSRSSSTSRGRGYRRCRLEAMEPRLYLSASPIHVGMVYYEDAGGDDNVPDTFEVTFQGGAPGTQLTRLVIETDKLGDGLTIGDTFFDTAPGGLGAFGSVPFAVVSQSGIDDYRVFVEDGGTNLVLEFAGFDAGDRFLFSIDVDEMGFLGPNAVAEGNEFEGSQLHVTFAAPHYYQAAGMDIFLDAYDTNLEQSGLALPSDSYSPPLDSPNPVRTAGAFVRLEQVPLPVRIAGKVFVDPNLNNQRDAGEPGLAGVTVQLWREEAGGYGFVAQTVTDAAGDYRFDDLTPGTYRLVELQPSGYLSVGARVGTVDGNPRGSATDADTITDVVLLGGEESLHNDFAEVPPASLAGHVYHDANDNGVRESGESGIAGTVIRIIRTADAFAAAMTFETATLADGSWSVAGLYPGVYTVEEIQPFGYLDGKDAAGSLGGTVISSADRIVDIRVPAGATGTDYDFGELLPGSLSGFVHLDINANCRFDPGEPFLPGVTIQLLNAQGEVIAAAVTDADGAYRFDDLAPGTYGLREIQPDDYFDGCEHPGTAGGERTANDLITAIVLGSGIHAGEYIFAEIPPARLSGYVYEDDDADGWKDPGERGIPGVRMELRDAAGNPTGLIAETDASGYFEFARLRPGEYQLIETQPEGYLDGIDRPGTAGGTAHNPGDNISGIRLNPADEGRDYWFGEIRPAMLAGRVFSDQNLNNAWDETDDPIAGVVIRLRDATGSILASTVTDAEGRYRFEGLAPGYYSVEEIQPEGYLDGADLIGTAGGIILENDHIGEIKLLPGTKGLNYDFAEVRPGSISGYVFQDGSPVSYVLGTPRPDPYTVRDGVFTPDDTPLAGVELRLADGFGRAILDESGRPIVTYTDSRGHFEFKGLRPGTYTVIEVQPAGYDDGLESVGTLGGIAFNPGNTEALAILDELLIDPKNDAIVRIQLPAGGVGLHYHFAEVLITAIPPWIPPVIPPSNPPRLQPAFVPPFDAPPPVVRLSPVAPNAPELPKFAGSGGGVDYTWHLSVINAGYPRHEADGLRQTVIHEASFFNPATWQGLPMDRALWMVADADGSLNAKYRFGTEGGIPVTGDFNGDGRGEIGVFFSGMFFIDLNGNGIWDEGDLWIRLGKDGDRPAVGDWDGDGKTDVAIFGPSWNGDERALRHEPGLPDALNVQVTARPKNLPPLPTQAPDGYRVLRRGPRAPDRTDLIDHVFRFGEPGDFPVAGDWNGDGVATIGLYRGGVWYLDVDGDGRWSDADAAVPFGEPGDIPVVGDWNGDGITDLGLFRRGTFLLDSDGDRALTARDRVFAMGRADDLPFAIDLNGDGRSEVGVYRYENTGLRDGSPPLQASMPKSAVGSPDGARSDPALGDGLPAANPAAGANE
ncbi:MAG: SdrD B-like domain-containing protein [Thermogutta sp.]